MSRTVDRTVRALGSAYATDGLARAVAEYAHHRRTDRRFAAAAALAELLVQPTRIARELLRYDELITALGTGPGSRHALRRWRIEPTQHLASGVGRVLDGEAFLAFGNHATGLECAVFNALLDRDDVRYLAGTFIARVGPGLGRLVLGVHNTEARSAALPPGGWRNRLLTAVEAAVWPPQPGFAARRANHDTVLAAADHLGRGGGVHVFPTGSMHTGAPWQSGIGLLVRAVLRTPTGRPVWLVPIVYGVTDSHLMWSAFFPALSLPGLAGRVAGLAAPRPLYVYAPPPVALADQGWTERTPATVISADLELLWRSAADDANERFGGWRDAGRRLAADGGSARHSMSDGTNAPPSPGVRS